MNVSILQRGSCLYACLPAALADSELIRLHDVLIQKVSSSRPLGVIIDIAALDVIDSFASRTFGDLAAKIRRKGAKVVLVGIKPDVAVAAWHFGLKLGSVAIVPGSVENLADRPRFVRTSVTQRVATRYCSFESLSQQSKSRRSAQTHAAQALTLEIACCGTRPCAKTLTCAQCAISS